MVTPQDLLSAIRVLSDCFPEVVKAAEERGDSREVLAVATALFNLCKAKQGLYELIHGNRRGEEKAA